MTDYQWAASKNDFYIPHPLLKHARTDRESANEGYR